MTKDRGTDPLAEVPAPDPVELGAFLRGVLMDDPQPRPRAVGLCTRYTDRDGKVSCWHSKDDYDWWIKASGNGFRLTTIQGSYTNANPDSANTHAKGGVKDIELDGYAKAECIRQCKLARDRGLLAWPRFWSGNWHAHVIDPMCPNMAPELEAQVVLFGKGYDGLVGNNPDPLGGYGKALIMSLFAKRFSTVISPPPTALATTTVIENLTSPLSKGAFATTQARTKQGGTAYAQGSHVYEFQPAGSTSWVAFKTLPVTNGVSSFLWNYSSTQLVRVRFVPKDATKSTPSTSPALRPEVVDVAALQKAYATVQASVSGLEAQVAALTAENADLRAQLDGSHPSEPVSAYGVDVSGWQTPEQVRALVADPRNEFVIVKATEGYAYLSDGWPEHRDIAGAKYLGAYHYLLPPQTPTQEMDHFLEVTGGAGVLAVDVEAFKGVADRDPLTPEQEAVLATCTLDSVRYLHAKGKRPLVYTNWLWLPRIRRGCTVAQWEELVDLAPLWLAEIAEAGKHSTVDPKPGSSKGWDDVLVHQYSYTKDTFGLAIDRDWTPDIARLRQLAQP